ncbi:hypothetical protein PR202_ga11220 [Eleusine coracana subsp. coracana]|uniref:Jacalin-type lectin domain-containing protein n=1 Tax=Eleusine coracana subsp. coracana TaxID=191504 RepID=A0AAV5C8H4_ELECO|nr:hypothetical protein QOZ80_5AG0405330 [Eleusine coracana subsp. coracana]GJM94563.1 hypothetical protein PR202_ga11220 [Eleusine coracana subsp. coracana]
MEGLVKIGLWGGGGGELHDIAVAPHRLDSIVIRCDWAVDAISFTYTAIDGTSHKAGQWGGSGGRKREVKLGETEFIKEISGTYGPFEGHAGIVRSLTFVTNVGKHGPFGNSKEGTPFIVPLQNGGRVVGFFGRSGQLLDAIGIYVHP